MKTKIIEKLQEYAYFIWLILLIFIAVFVTYFYDTNKKNQKKPSKIGRFMRYFSA